MKRLYIIVFLVIAAAGALGLAIAQHAGYVLIAYNSFRYESSLWATLLLLAVIWLVLWGAALVLRDHEEIRIDLMDDADFSMFELGTTILTREARALLGIMAETLKDERAPLILRGHTDSLPWRGGVGANNWSLSSGRAEATRQALVLGGVALPDDDEYNTVAGMMIERFGRIPHVGERLDWAGWRFEVVDLDGARIDKLLLQKLPETDGEDLAV